MNGWIVLALLAGVPTLTALIVYAAERDLRQREERFQRSLEYVHNQRKARP